VAYQLVEQFGVLDRRRADEHVRALSRQERRVLKSFGVCFGAFSLYLPELLTEEALTIGAPFAELAAPRWRPDADRLTVLPHSQPPPEALGLRGLRAVAGMAAPVLALERLDALSREAASERAGLVELTPALLAALGWEPGQADQILRALGFVRVRRSDPAEANLWRRRRMAPHTPSRPQAPPDAAVDTRPRRESSSARRARRRARRRAAAAAGTAG